MSKMEIWVLFPRGNCTLVAHGLTIETRGKAVAAKTGGRGRLSRFFNS